MVDLLVEFAPWRVHIYILPCCSTAAATVLNSAGDGAQFARSRCSISGGILNEFGTVASGFASSVKPTLQVQVNGNVSNNYKIINRADVGGQYLSEWQTANTVWVTTVYRFENPTPLPKTGY